MNLEKELLFTVETAAILKRDKIMLPYATVFPTGDLQIEFEGIHIQIIRFSKISDAVPWSIQLHAHDNFEFHYIFKGKGMIQLGTKRFRIRKNQIYVCAPFIKHSQFADETDPLQEYCIECKISFSTEQKDTESDYFSRISKETYFDCYDSEEEDLLYKFNELSHIYNNTNDFMHKGERTYAKSIFFSILIKMVLLLKNNHDEIARKNDINHIRAIDIKNYLDANVSEKISIQDCSKKFNLSERQIDRIMKQEFGTTFYQILMKLRVNVAIQLLYSTCDDMEQIAWKAGFSSYRQMIRHFNSFGAGNPSTLRREAKREGGTEKYL